MGWKGRAHVLPSYLRNHSLINALAAHLEGMCLYGDGDQAILPPKISPVLPGSPYQDRGVSLTSVTPETPRQAAHAIAVWATRLGFADPSTMDIDSTVQEANIAYPSDAHLMVNMTRLVHKVWT
jgi:hypothetical protein